MINVLLKNYQGGVSHIRDTLKAALEYRIDILLFYFHYIFMIFMIYMLYYIGNILHIFDYC